MRLFNRIDQTYMRFIDTYAETNSVYICLLCSIVSSFMLCIHLKIKIKHTKNSSDERNIPKKPKNFALTIMNGTNSFFTTMAITIHNAYVFII